MKIISLFFLMAALFLLTEGVKILEIYTNLQFPDVVSLLTPHPQTRGSMYARRSVTPAHIPRTLNSSSLLGMDASGTSDKI